ncbi:uncharacterized protein LOC120632536 [Pararge aegeria]|uniref:uncharacterized protein LOC120632536 n=1 Tax=Pararge aegeria TaxID=116150 RepID=UPI0019D1A1BD|nr:uncharacterized protein LOC120632536 [Pararge aegeria]
MSNLKELIIKRSSVKGRVTKFKNYISKFSKSSSLDSLQIGELKIKINKFECLSSEFSELQGQIETLNADELEDELDIREELENEIDSAMSLAQDILTRFSKNFNFEDAHSSSTHQGCGGNSQGLGFKLPLIQVPRFDGSASRWMQFKEMFSSLINENSNILPIYKFHYLVSYLEGDAARVVSNLEVCALNYNKAWSLLCERYDNKRQLINSHLNALFSIEPLTRESEQALRSLIDGVSKNLRALSSLGQPTDQWDTLIIYMASSKLDNQTSMKWEEHRNTLSDIPTLEQFHKFLKDRADVLESFNQHKIQNKRITSSHGVSGPSSNNNYTRNSKQNKVFSYVTQPSSNNNTNRYRTRCIVCKGNHFIYTCPSFLAKSPELRIAEAQRLQLCMNCLRSTHKTRDCLGGTCRECGKLHATILHRPTNQEPATPAQGSSDTVAAQTAVEEISVNISRQPISHVILSTVSIRVTNPKNSKSEIIRTLLDSGSQSSFLTQRVKERLNLEAIPTDINIIGIGNNTNNYVTERCFVQVSSLHSDYNTNLSCFIMPELTGNIPKAYIDRKQIDIPNHIQLADPNFYISGPVDAIIGADLFWEVIGNNIQSLGKNSPFIYNSKFGWVISGPISVNNKIKHTHCNFVSSNSLDDRLEKQISKFWEIEEMPKRSLLSDSERACEQHFQTHTTRLESGRFCVRLPLKDSPSVLGDSFSQAKKRFLNLERRFRKQPHLKQAYAACINEYIDLGHCSELSSFTPRSGYFLCHHPIFKKIQENTDILYSMQIPRYVISKDNVTIELHSFSDASMFGYGTCIYVKTIDAYGRSSVQLLCAKSRVAPSGKPMTIPRLELSAALLAAKLCASCLTSIRARIANCIHWCDSSVVLGWIKTSPTKLKMFVANRVAEICENTQSSSWRYVPTNLNPADLISRGIDANRLRDSTLWWNGPEFLLQEQHHWPTLNSNIVQELPELKVHSSIIEPNLIIFENHSNFTKLSRCFSYVLRCIHNCTHPNSRRTGNLTTIELDESFARLVIFSQLCSFQREYTCLANKSTINTKSKLLSLSPFLDENKVMRVGGRLDSSTYSYEKRHPIVLDGKHHFTKLLFRREHLRLLHAGPQALLYSVRETVWPLGGRCLARRTVRECVLCRRHQGRTLNPMMGNLPSQRVMPAFPFHTVGIDFAGPFQMLTRKGRGAKTIKCYLCLFICFRYKCVHLEAVTDLSKDALILTMRRMISRRGKPAQIFSDNGRNLVAAAREITEFLKTNPVISDFAADNQIKFSFLPAYAPHLAGLWEAGIKSAKHHIKRYIGNNKLTFEELSTLFAQVEAILNSRPLYPMSSSPNDMLPLSPGHFLIGRPLTSLPSPQIEDSTSTSSLDRYARIESIRQQFWRRWQREYISELQQHTKWRTNKDKLHVGDLVILQDDNLAPLHWRMGRVVGLFPGPDGISRVAEIKTTRGVVRRALTRICPLLSETSS